MKIRQTVRERLEILLGKRHSVSFYPQSDIHISMLGKPFKRRKFKAMRLLPHQKNAKAFLTKGIMDLPEGAGKAERSAMKAANFAKNYARPINMADFEPVTVTPEQARIMVENQMATYHKLVADGKRIAV